MVGWGVIERRFRNICGQVARPGLPCTKWRGGGGCSWGCSCSCSNGWTWMGGGASINAQITRLALIWVQDSHSPPRLINKCLQVKEIFTVTFMYIYLPTCTNPVGLHRVYKVGGGRGGGYKQGHIGHIIFCHVIFNWQVWLVCSANYQYIICHSCFAKDLNHPHKF